MYYKVVGDANHNDLAAKTVVVTIAKADASATAPTAKTLTYTGAAQALVDAGVAAGGEMQYSVDNVSYSTTIPQGTNASNYTVYYKVVGDANHNDMAAKTVAVSIAKADASATAPTAKTLTYTGAAQTLVNAGVANGGVMQYSLDDVSYSTTIPQGTNAGDYTVYYKVVGDANHNNMAAKTVTVTIAKATLSSVTLVSAEVYYTGSEVTAIVANVKAGEVVVPPVAYTVSGNKATALGNYMVTVTAVAGGNFQGQAQTTYAVVTSPSDKAAFEAYKTSKKTEADALGLPGDSEACQILIADAKALIDALTYDEMKTLAENKAAVDAILAPVPAALDAQRADDYAAYKVTAFAEYKTDQMAAADALLGDEDSSTSYWIVAEAKAAINDLTYDGSKTLDQNKAMVDAIMDQLKKDLSAQREKELKERRDAMRVAFINYKSMAMVDIDKQARDDDSDASKKLMEDAKQAIHVLIYDYDKTLTENREIVDAIFKQLLMDLETQRAADLVNAVKSPVSDADEVWYDLKGRKLVGKPTKPGVYIKNGKKIVVDN